MKSVSVYDKHLSYLTNVVIRVMKFDVWIYIINISTPSMQVI